MTDTAPTGPALTIAEVLADLVRQFACPSTVKGQAVMTDGALSAMEYAFALIGLPDPCPEAEFEQRIAAWVEGQRIDWKGISESLFYPVPSWWPPRRNACNQRCDMLNGPCACGAWHHFTEEWVRKGIKIHKLRVPQASAEAPR